MEDSKMLAFHSFIVIDAVQAMDWPDDDIQTDPIRSDAMRCRERVLLQRLFEVHIDGGIGVEDPLLILPRVIQLIQS